MKSPKLKMHTRRCGRWTRVTQVTREALSGKQTSIAGSVHVHFNWKFFAFHRAYLYFHERILGKLINDLDFRLPYWDWDVSSHRKLPGAYTNPNNSSNPLFNSTRGMSPTDEIPSEDVDDDVMDAALEAADFTEFGGTATGSGIPEGAPHG